MVFSSTMLLSKRASSFKDSLMYIKRNNMVLADKVKPILNIQDMPHPKSIPIIGTKLNFFVSGTGAKLHEYVDRRHKELGPIFYENLGGNGDLVFISDPVLMKSIFLNLEGKYPTHILPEPWILYDKLYGSKRGLFFMNGEEWLNNRRIMNKYLLREGAESWIKNPVMKTVSRFIAKWNLKAKEGKFIPDLEADFYRLSTDVIIQILLGTDSSLKPNKCYDNLIQIFSETVKKIFETTTKLYGIPVQWCERLNLKVWRDFKSSVDSSLFMAQKIVREIIIANKQNKQDNGLIRRLCDEEMSDDTITSIISDFVIAASDTTAYTSMWILYLISQNNGTKEEILASRDNLYVKNVIKEAMRLYPVAPFLTRILPRKCDLGPYTLNEGTPIIASIYTSGRDEKNFSNPDKFLPYCWDRNDLRKQNLVNHVSSASLPFALGARSCIGKKIATVQLTEIVTQILHNFDFECINTSDVKAATSQVLIPSEKIQLLFSSRNMM